MRPTTCLPRAARGHRPTAPKSRALISFPFAPAPVCSWLGHLACARFSAVAGSISNRNTPEIRIASNSHITIGGRISNRNILHRVSLLPLLVDHWSLVPNHHFSNRQNATPSTLETGLTHTKQSPALLPNGAKEHIFQTRSLTRLSVWRCPV